MKKLLALAVCLMLLGSVTVNGTFASDFSFTDFFDAFKSVFGGVQENKDHLDVETTVEMRVNGTLKEEDENNPQMIIPINQTEGWDANTTGWTDVRYDEQYEYQLWNQSGVIDKFIFVKNNTSKGTGKDAYFRTAISIRADEDAWQVLKINRNKGQDENGLYYQWTDWEPHKKGNENWYTAVATYTRALAPGETAPALMMQVAIENRRELTNELMTKFGERFRIETHTVAIDMETFKNSSDDTQMSAMEALDMAAPIQSFLTN